MRTSPAIDKREACRLLEEMIRINSVNPGLVPGGKGELEMAVYLAALFNEEKIPAEVVILKDQRANVIARLKGEKPGRVLMLNGHLDTVGTAGMTDPLSPRLEGSKMYGRGSGDMKAGLVSIFLAMKALKDQGLPEYGEVLFTGVADEEYKSIGTEAVAGEYPADGAVITEPTQGELVVAHKGFIWMDVAFSGVAAHGSVPAEGVDAIAKAGRFLVAMEEYGQKVLTRRHHPLLGHPSLHASLIQGGRELSTYPDHCLLSVEIRTLPGETVDLYEEEIGRILQGLAALDPDFQAKASVTFSRPPMEAAQEEPIVRSAFFGAHQALGREPFMTGISGWLDSAILQEAGIPTVIYGPVGSGFHGAGEYADLDSVVEVARGLWFLAQDFLKGETPQ